MASVTLHFFVLYHLSHSSPLNLSAASFPLSTYLFQLRCVDSAIHLDACMHVPGALVGSSKDVHFTKNTFYGLRLFTYTGLQHIRSDNIKLWKKTPM
jgi:hypothetical protein